MAIPGLLQLKPMIRKHEGKWAVFGSLVGYPASKYDKRLMRAKAFIDKLNRKQRKACQPHEQLTIEQAMAKFGKLNRGINGTTKFMSFHDESGEWVPVYDWYSNLLYYQLRPK